jgi:hypothetical protein
MPPGAVRPSTDQISRAHRGFGGVYRAPGAPLHLSRAIPLFGRLADSLEPLFEISACRVYFVPLALKPRFPIRDGLLAAFDLARAFRHCERVRGELARDRIVMLPAASCA